MDQLNQGLGILVALAITISILLVFFFITRKFVLWYWKIDEAISHLKKMSGTLENLEKLFVRWLEMHTQALEVFKRLDQKAANLEEDDPDAKA